MFETITLATNDGRIRQAWNKLIRKIQTDVEHKRVNNDTASILARGQVVCASGGDRKVSLANAAVPATAPWAGVICEPVPTEANGGAGVMRTQGLAYVKFDTGLGGAVVSGVPVYVSAANSGNATTTQNLYRMGTIADTTGFHSTTNAYAWVWLGRCCTPQNVA